MRSLLLRPVVDIFGDCSAFWEGPLPYHVEWPCELFQYVLAKLYNTSNSSMRARLLVYFVFIFRVPFSYFTFFKMLYASVSTFKPYLEGNSPHRRPPTCLLTAADKYHLFAFRFIRRFGRPRYPKLPSVTFSSHPLAFMSGSFIACFLSLLITSPLVLHICSVTANLSAALSFLTGIDQASALD